MVGIEVNKKVLPREGNGGPDIGPNEVSDMGSSPSASKIFDPSNQVPIFKKDLYADLQKIEDRGKRKKGFLLFSRDKK